jgi:hypothetical protein
MHRGPNVSYIPISRDDYRAQNGIDLRQLPQERQAIHAGHIDIRQD